MVKIFKQILTHIEGSLWSRLFDAVQNRAKLEDEAYGDKPLSADYQKCLNKAEKRVDKTRDALNDAEEATKNADLFTIATIALALAIIAAFTTAIFTAFPPSAWFRLF